MKRRISRFLAVILSLCMVISMAAVTSADTGSDFTDVQDRTQYYYDAVNWAADQGITKGYSDGSFGVGKACERKDMLIFLWRISGKPDKAAAVTFNDIDAYVPGTDTYKAISWGVANGITKGFADGGFHPLETVNRKDALIMLYRLAGKPDVSGKVSYPDAQIYQPGTDTYNAILWAEQEGITKGYADGSFRPLENCLREQIVTFLNRYCANAEAARAFGSMPAGEYTFVNGTPAAEAGSGKGQVQFIYGSEEDNVKWSFDQNGKVITGTETAKGSTLEFFNQLHISDRPLYDWLASNPRNTEGYEGNLSGKLLLTISEEGRLSGIEVTDGTVNVVAVLAKDMAADVLTVTGATRGQPNLLQSSVTLMGSANHVHLTAQGNAILNELTLGSDADGVGLSSDKIGGDTFIVGTVFVDGKIEWLNRYANVQPVKEGLSATIETNGQDMIFGGTNVGRVRRSLNFVSNGGDIIIGKDISVDYGRGKVLDDPSTGTLTLSTTGTIDAGSGNVIIGTNDYRVLKIDQIGDIKAADVIIKPTDNGKITQVSTSIGNIDASGNVDIEIGTVNTGNDANASIGNITAGGNISLKAGHINGTVGNVKAGGDALVNIGSLDNIGEVTGKNVNVNIGDKPEAPGEEAVPLANVTFNGVKTEFNAYKVGEGSFFRIRDIAYQLAETDKKFSVEWTGNIDGIVTVTKGRDYTPNGTEMKAAGTETAQAFEVKPSVYVDSEKISCRGYKIGDDIYFNIDDLAAALGFDVEYYDDVVAIERPAGNDTFGHMPAGTYTYVASDPSADAESGKGQVSFIYDEEGADLIWEAVNEGTIIEGSEDISGDVWEFFYGVFLSDLPVTDWLQGEPKDTEGYAGNVSGNLDITITEDGKISALAVTSAATRVTAVLTPDITAPVLTVTGITQSRPYFLQSCITMVGAANALNLTRQGDVILDNFTAGSDENGIGLYGSKIGGDTFISGTFFIDGAISWNSKMGVITALEGEPGGTIMTNGQEIVINGGSNTGRAGRILNIISNGGDIKIGTMVSTDQTRGGIIPNPTAPDILSVSTSGIIDAGSGDVIIGTDAREDKGVEIDRLGTVKGNNVIIKPVNYGEPGNIVAYIGNIEAEGNVEIEAGIINTGGVQTSSFSSSDGTIERVIEVDEALIDKSGIVIGDITSENGNITVKASKVYGKVGTFTAPNGTVTTEFEQITE